MPMYGVEATVVRTLRSIYAQAEAAHCQVILVDDGSPDRSAAVAREWLERQPLDNWQIIRQENRGLGGARNTGLRHASAPYVWFIDTDDEIAPNSLATILPHLTASPAAISFTALDRPADTQRHKVTEGVFNGKDLISAEMQPCVPFYVWRKDILTEHGIEFKERLLHEDNEFTPRALFFCKHIVCIDQPLYIVHHTGNSITRSINQRRSFHYLRAIDSLTDFTAKFVEDHATRKRYRRLVANLICGMLSHTRPMDTATRKEFTASLKPHSKRLSREMIMALNHRSLIGLVLFISPSLAISIYKR